MNETVFRVVLPAYLVVSLAAVCWKRWRVRRLTGREAIHTGTFRGADTPAEFAASVLVLATAALVADVVLRALWPAQVEALLTLPALGGLIAARGSGLALISAGVGLYVFGLMAMGESWRIGIDSERPGPLVTHGAFAHVRHPLYAGILLAAFGMAVLTADVVAIAALAAVGTGVPIQARLEEEFLAGRYAEYAKYRARTGRFFPRWRSVPPHASTVA